MSRTQTIAADMPMAPRRARASDAWLLTAMALVACCALLGPLLTRDAAAQPLPHSPAAVVPQPEPTNAPQAPRPEVGAAAAAAAVAAPEPAQPEAEPSQRLALPDGTTVATLNGAVDAPPLADYWGNFAWSPIVGVERSSAGIDWYRHADGSYSTTQMVWRSDLNRYAAMTRVAHPGPAETPQAAGRR